jgi:hypothetical protein
MMAAGDRVSECNATLGRGRDLYRHPECGTLSPNPVPVCSLTIIQVQARNQKKMRMKKKIIIGLAIHPRQTRFNRSSRRWLDAEVDQMMSKMMIPPAIVVVCQGRPAQLRTSLSTARFENYTPNICCHELAGTDCLALAELCRVETPSDVVMLRGTAISTCCIQLPEF